MLKENASRLRLRWLIPISLDETHAHRKPCQLDVGRCSLDRICVVFSYSRLAFNRNGNATCDFSKRRCASSIDCHLRSDRLVHYRHDNCGCSNHRQVEAALVIINDYRRLLLRKNSIRGEGRAASVRELSLRKLPARSRRPSCGLGDREVRRL